MNKQAGWRPEKALVLAVVLIGVTVVAAVGLMLTGVLRGGRTGEMMPYSIAVVVAGGIASYLILARARRLRRQQRPDWLETQAWRQGLSDKLGTPEESARRQPPKLPPES
jgi:MFS superfamily sulfate permease-like transporter